MKFVSLMRFFLICACSWLSLKSQAAEKPPSKTSATTGQARLIVQRTPNFGSNLVVRLSIDGKKVADIPRNQHYGGFISSGRHSLTVLSIPNTEHRRATSVRLTVKSRQVYIYTAAWDSNRLVLVPSTLYSPSTRVPAETTTATSKSEGKRRK